MSRKFHVFHIYLGGYPFAYLLFPLNFCNAPQDQGSSSQDSGTTDDKTKEDKAAWLKKLKDDIALREKEAAELEASLNGGGDKRKNDGDDDDGASSNKKVKTEDNE